eukprot:364240-Chlamydomonas_euryale.AAC.2
MDAGLACMLWREAWPAARATWRTSRSEACVAFVAGAQQQRLRAWVQKPCCCESSRRVATPSDKVQNCDCRNARQNCDRQDARQNCDRQDARQNCDLRDARQNCDRQDARQNCDLRDARQNCDRQDARQNCDRRDARQNDYNRRG